MLIRLVYIHVQIVEERNVLFIFSRIHCILQDKYNCIFILLTNPPPSVFSVKIFNEWNIWKIFQSTNRVRNAEPPPPFPHFISYTTCPLTNPTSGGNSKRRLTIFAFKKVFVMACFVQWRSAYVGMYIVPCTYIVHLPERERYF